LTSELPHAPSGSIARWHHDVQPFAFGMLGLRPWELLRFTLREFGHLVEGYNRAQYRERYRVAELAVWVLSPWIGKGSKLTPDDLIGTVRREDL